MSAIEFENVYFKYKKELPLILNDVSFKVEYGKITLLNGYSGSGKTTILSLVCGVIPNLVHGLIKGKIKVNDKSIKGKSISEITSKVGLVMQNVDEQIIQTYVCDELAFGCENINMDVDKIKENVSYFANLLELNLSDKTKTLSGGQKQRLISGSILAMGHRIIVLDEPLANLDTKGAILLLNTLNKLKEQGYAILIVEHRLDIIKDYVDVIYYLNEGKVSNIDNIDYFLSLNTNKIIDIINTKEEDVIISVNNLSYKIDNKLILDNISFNINKGQRLLILGENGAGKTTLIRLLCGIIKSKKNIKYNLNTKKILSKIGFVFQNPNYQLFMPTVYEEVYFNCKDKKIAEDLLKSFRLYEYKDRHPQSLSLGQKRRLTVAMTLAKKPEVLILDEPTVGQDYESLVLMINYLNEYQYKNNTTFITITHDKRCANAFGSKVIWIKDSKIYKEGKEEVINEFFL